MKAFIPDPQKASDVECLAYFELISVELLKKRSTPKDKKVREVLMEYYSMKQESAEHMCEFAHQFHDVSYVELRHAFSITSHLSIT